MLALLGKSFRVMMLLSAALLAGCATAPPTSDPEALAEFHARNDPLEPANRFLYKVNDALDTVVLKPAAQAYRFVLPQPVRNSVHNALTNLGTPVRLVNDMLQGKPRRAGDTAMRFVINSTVGALGLFDVAADWGYPEHSADFGLTMALWGVPDGPYLFLPVLGPSNMRDIAGFGVDVAADPWIWVGQGVTVETLRWSRVGVAVIDARDRNADLLDTTRKTALDPYATFRSLYQQHRRSEMRTIRDDHRATPPAWFPQSGSAGAAANHP